jgi:putative SOS response-associated peptidase YedK
MGARLINARSETVQEKPSFREALKKRRCIIPADGFYEWQRTATRKQPYFFHLGNNLPFGFAGLWDRWRSEDGEVIESCAILTTEANELLRPIHERMPVILQLEDHELWLDHDARTRGLLMDMLRPYPASEMVAYPVGTQVNKIRSQGPGLVDRMPNNSA